MEAALVSAATGALQSVLEKLFALMADEYKHFKEVPKDIKFLSDELKAMYAFLLKMSEEEEDPDPQDKAWVNEVRELSYDMEDSIDDFLRRVDDKDPDPQDKAWVNEVPDGFMQKIKHFLGKIKHSWDDMKTRRRIGIEIQDLKKQIVEVGARNTRYRTPGQAFSKTNNQTVDPRALAIFKHASELVGIDEPKNELVKLLMEEDLMRIKRIRRNGQDNSCKPKMVSIVGSGGMGKTTLASQAYQELKGQFDCHAIAPVSRNPDMIKVLTTILSQVTDKDCADILTVEHLISKISNFLANKRYFIVVDDIWDKKTWDVIKCIFPDNSHGSKIITTTRVNDVAKSCQSSFGGHIYKIRPLDMVHSRQLFHQRLFGSEEDCPPHLKKVSDQILEKCDGLPLAIIAISGLLANTEKTNHQWDRVKDSIGCGIEINDDVKGMMKILSLSYFDLPAHLKTCLLYLSVFPEDYIIRKKPLIRKWIAEGFIHKEGRYAAHELGERCFNELVNRSLIQPVKTNKINGKVQSCRVHDIILDFIISKSVEENFVTLVGGRNPSTKTQSTVRRLSLQVGKQGSCILTTGMSLSHVRSVNVFGDLEEIPSLDRFKHLRVMDLEGCLQLENHHLANIGRLFQLRFLSFKGTWIEKLPEEEIGRLRCLETLDLTATHVRELPKSIVNLENLVHLLGQGFPGSFPNGIAKMQALETLQRVDAFEQSLAFLQDLGQLQSMRKLWLDLTDSSSVKEEWVEALVSSLRELATHNNLRSVTLRRYPCSLLMEPWYSAPAGLQELIAEYTAVPHVPDWMRFLVNLQRLYLAVEGVGQKDLCILGGLPALLSLTLRGTARSKEKLIVNGGVGFPCLKEFGYYIVIGGMELMFAAGSGSMPMPKLETLGIRFDAAETESLCGTSGGAAFDFGIENLPCLVTVECGPLGLMSTDDPSTVEAAKAAMERAASAHPNSPTLRFNEW